MTYKIIKIISLLIVMLFAILFVVYGVMFLTVNDQNIKQGIVDFYETGLNKVTGESNSFYFDDNDKFDEYVIVITKHDILRPVATLAQSNEFDETGLSTNIYVFEMERAGLNTFRVKNNYSFYAENYDFESIVDVVSSTNLSTSNPDTNNITEYKSLSEDIQLQLSEDNDMTNEQKQCEEDYINGIISAKEYRDCLGLGW